MTIVYLATPIDFVNSTFDTAKFKHDVTVLLSDAGYTVYDPAKAWSVNGPMTEELARVIEGTNRQALRRSDVIVAWLPEGVPTQGVPAELEFATRHQGIPGIVIGHVGAAVMANPLASVLRESDIGKLPRQVELLLIDRKYSDFRIRYSSPTDVPLAPVHSTDAGIDLPCWEDVTIPGLGSYNVSTGVRLELPVGTFGWIVARSSTYERFGVQVLPGVIDQGYQGELKINCLNTLATPCHIERGDRLGQLLIMHNSLAGFQLTKVDPGQVHPFKTQRGTSGFGSTGR